jgi:hypothetical protein
LTEKSEAISPCKERLVIPVNKAVGKKRIIGNRGLMRRRGKRGRWPPKRWTNSDKLGGLFSKFARTYFVAALIKLFNPNSE